MAGFLQHLDSIFQRQESGENAGQVPVIQAGGTEFEPQYQQKNSGVCDTQL